MTIVEAHSKTPRARKFRAPRPGNGRIATAQHDDEIASMAARIAEAREAERQAKIATAAYFRAQQRGFAPGHELEDWLAAEAEMAEAPLFVVSST